MGKSFNDDIFNNSFNLDSINGLNISQEAINENKKNIDIKNNNDLDEAKKQFNEMRKQHEKPQDDIKELLKENIKNSESLKDKEKEIITRTIIETTEQDDEDDQQEKITFTKKTMIFNQEHLDIIDGLAQLNNMQIKDVLNQLLGRAINQLDDTTREKALKTGRKAKATKVNKNLF